ncbi:MAG: hypothetical protein Q7S55_04210 [Nanoarchaeota archaeon]|nr:hypothetical protein [Nanoarchaeota archaeon]
MVESGIEYSILKEQIEATTSLDGLSVGEREFAWIYIPGKPIKILPECRGLATLFAGGSNTNVIEFIPPKDTYATAFIHNHPSSNVTPSYEDTVTFLSLMATNQKLKYSIIAATKGGKVNGFLQMTYTGERSAIPLEAITTFYGSLCEKRQNEIREGRYQGIWGECIFSLDELRKIDTNIIAMAGLQLHFVAMPGYKRQDFKFCKI